MCPPFNICAAAVAAVKYLPSLHACQQQHLYRPLDPTHSIFVYSPVPIFLSSLHLPFFLPPRDTCSPKSAHLRAFACHVKNNRLLHHATACLQLCTPVLPFKIVPIHPSYLQLSLPYLSISTPVLPHICTTNLYSYCTSHLSIFSPTPVLSTIFPLHLKCQLFSTLRLSRHILFPLHLFSRHICPPIQLLFPDHFFFLSRARLCLSRRVTR